MAKNPWHKRVERKGAAMQEASVAVAAFIAALQERGQHMDAEAIRGYALHSGVLKAALQLERALARFASRGP